jgi:3-phytase
LLVGALALSGFLGDERAGTSAGLVGSARAAAPIATVTATLETEPVTHSKDAADDAAIWIHPTNPAQSTLIGTDKKGALEVYDINTGRKIQTIPLTTVNVDLRYNFPLAGQRVAIVATRSSIRDTAVFYKVNPATRLLEEVTDSAVRIGAGGTALYRSPVTGKFYYFSNRAGKFMQYELFDTGNGTIGARRVRTVKYGSGVSEGIVADDIHAALYVSHENVGLLKFVAEPHGGSQYTVVDRPVAQGGHFTPHLEGLTIYYRSDGTGYLLASSQGSHSYNIYERAAPHNYIGTFSIANGVVDGTSETDGIDVTNFPLGPSYPQGLFVVQDGANVDGGAKANQNFKLVPWERIAAVFDLAVDTSWDPRLVGAP